MINFSEIPELVMKLKLLKDLSNSRNKLVTCILEAKLDSKNPKLSETACQYLVYSKPHLKILDELLLSLLSNVCESLDIL